MPTVPKPVAKPATSRLSLLTASLAEPLAVVATYAIGLLLVVFGLVKLLPTGVLGAPTTLASGSASVDLLSLATGGVITAPWGVYLVGILQLALGLGLLIPSARALAALGCLLAAASVAVGLICQWSQVSSSNGVTSAGVALIILFVLLLAGAALGARTAARRVGAAS